MNIYLECRKVASTELDPDEDFQGQIDEFIQAEGDGALEYDMEWVIVNENGEELSQEEAREVLREQRQSA